jgi:hypothetical protein
MRAKTVIILIASSILLTACNSNSDNNIPASDTIYETPSQAPDREQNTATPTTEANQENNSSPSESASKEDDEIILTPTGTPLTETTNPEKDKPNEPSKTQTSYLEELKAYKFEIEGKSYQLPFALGELTARGWELKYQDGTDFNQSDFLKPLEQTYGLVQKGKEKHLVTIINQTPTRSNQYKTFLIYQIDGNLNLPGGITLTSTSAEVEKAYGAPKNSDWSNPNWSVFRYKNPSTNYTEDSRFLSNGIELYTDKGKVKMIQLSHLDINLLDLVKRPENPYPYKTPSKTGSDLFTYTFSIANKNYSLPAPLSTFLTDGYQIKGIFNVEPIDIDKVILETLGKAGKVLAPSETLTLVLDKNDKIIIVTIKNEYDSFQYYKDCSVIGVRVLPLANGAAYKLPGNISIGSSENDLTSNIKGQSYIRYDYEQLVEYMHESSYYYNSDWVRYEVYALDSSKSEGNKIPYKGKVIFDVIDGKVREISVLRANKDPLGTVNKNDILNTTDNESDRYNYSEEEMINFLCYNGDKYSSWSEVNYVMTFNKKGHFTCYDAGAGNPWFLKYGDTVEGEASYTIDAKNKLILVEDYDRTINIHYNIVSSFEIDITIDDNPRVYKFYRR